MKSFLNLKVFKISLVVGIAACSVTSSLLISPGASAATGSDFNAGRIIDDVVFYNRDSMNTSNIQRFLESKVPNCDYNGTQSAADMGYPNITHAKYAEYKRNGSNGFKKDTGFHAPPYKCLTRYSQATPQMEAASGYCGAIGAGTRTAAQIINDVSKACGINPQVLIVLLEKEQSLVMDNWPLNRQLRSATGFACPDTAPCNPAYEGFFYQVYNAARQFKVYQAFPNSYNYVAGRNNKIYWQTNLGEFVNPSGNANDASRNGRSACGYRNVYIQNQATAALYIYTPYQPNQRALSNLYGTGDGCSAYGNRNFWRIFTDWFGNPTITVKGGIATKYNEVNGSMGFLGFPLRNERCGLTNGGCYQLFEGGSIYWSSRTGAHFIKGGIREKWSSLSFESGRLGYPTSDEICGLVNSGCYQTFQGGRIYWTQATGATVSWGGILSAYARLGYENGRLKYPTSSEVCSNFGCYQTFQGGRAYWTQASGAFAIWGGILGKYITINGTSTPLGYPTKEEVCDASGCYQQFQSGRIYWSEVNGAWPVWGGIGNKYSSQPNSVSLLGYPTQNETCGLTGNGCYQQFQNGRIYWSEASGAKSTQSAIYTRYITLGGETSFLKYPTSDVLCGYRDDGCYQQFQNGRIYWSEASGAWPVWGGIGNKYLQIGGVTSSQLGYPTALELYDTPSKTWSQTYQNGRILYSATQGARVEQN